MIRPPGLCRHAFLMAAAGSVALAQPQQPPPQFKANLKTKNGSDGTTSTGTMYFGGAKVRTELTSDGQNVIMLIDPAAKSQYMLVPSDKIYMQMPAGQGSGVQMPRPSDPTNPCATGSGNTDCTRGENERINGHEAIRWDYTNSDGVRTRAWISPRLHYAVKTQDDDGNLTELSNITEGAQAASLFSIPSGYTKMDMGMAGGGGGRGRGAGRGNASDPIASAMANMPADLQAQMAAAMRGDGPKSPTGTAGSGWEKTKGWVINLTVNGTASFATDKAINQTGQVTRKETYTLKIVGAIPLNVLGGASGMPGAPGPSWQLMYTDAIGSPEVLATPATFDVEVRGRIDDATPGTFASYCRDAAASAAAGLGIGDPATSVGIVKGDVDMRFPITKRAYDANAEGNIRISGDLKTYDLSAGFSTKGKETTETRTDTKSCKDGKVTTTNDTRTAAPEYSVGFEFKGLALPSTVGPISGSKKMPVKFAEHQYDATVSWTITPIR